MGSKLKRTDNITVPSSFFETTNKRNLQPHIPIYQQQLAVNPAIFSTHHSMNGERNLCGYDSVLHAKICNGGKMLADHNNIYDETAFSPQLNFRRKLQTANFKEYLDLKAKKNVKNNLLYAKLSEKSKNDINVNNKFTNDNRDISYSVRKDEQLYNIELENLISSSSLSSSDDECKDDQEQTKSNSSNDNHSFSSSMIHRYVHEHIHHHYHHFENQDD